jgi:hypothetical protein
MQYHLKRFIKYHSVSTHHDLSLGFGIIHYHHSAEFGIFIQPTCDRIPKPVGRLSTNMRNVEYDEPFNDNSSAQTVGIDVKYCGTLTIVIAVDERKR